MFQSGLPCRVLSELTPSRTNVLQLSFLKRGRTSSISSDIETSSQEKSVPEKQYKRAKECDINVQYSDIELIPYTDTSSINTDHGEKVENFESSTFLRDDSTDICANHSLKSEKHNDAVSQFGSKALYTNKRTLFEPLLLSKEQIKKYAHVLKLRLRLAYYKLRINQPHSAFSTLPLLIPKQKKDSFAKSSKTILPKTVMSNVQLPSPISSQTHDVASVSSHNNDNLIFDTFNYSRYNIGLSSPPLSEERYCKDSLFPLDLTKDVSK